MRFLHVGVGGFGRRWTETLSQNPEAEVVALVDLSDEALAAACETGGWDESVCYHDLDEALDKVAADAAVISTPPVLHTPQALKAMEHGLHVITEKPMADTLDNCQRLLEATSANGLTYVVSQNYRYAPPTWTMAKQIRDGVIGEVGQVKIDFLKGCPFEGFRAEMDYPLIIDMSIHHFDLIRFMTGLNPVSVRGESWNPPWSHYKGDASSSLVFTMNNGARIVYTGSWCSQGSYNDWTGDWQIEGEKGALSYHEGEVQCTLLKPRYQLQSKGPVELTEPPATAQHYVLADFMRSIANGQRPATDIFDNIWSIGMVFAAVEALETGEEVTVGNEAIAKILADKGLG